MARHTGLCYPPNLNLLGARKRVAVKKKVGPPFCANPNQPHSRIEALSRPHVLGPTQSRLEPHGPTRSRHPHIQLRFANGVRCSRAELRRTSVLTIHLAGTGPRANLLITYLLHIQEAIDIVQESFPELRDVDRDRICLEVRVVLSSQQERKKAEISRSAWSAVVTTLARFEIVEIRVALPSDSAAAPSSSTTSAAEPPPYNSKTDWPLDVKESQMTLVSNSPPPISRSSSRTQSLANRFANLFTPKTS